MRTYYCVISAALCVGLVYQAEAAHMRGEPQSDLEMLYHAPARRALEAVHTNLEEHHHHSGHVCGAGLMPPVKAVHVPLPHPEGPGRRLAYVAASTADASQLGNVRMQLVWEVIHAGDVSDVGDGQGAQPRQCTPAIVASNTDNIRIQSLGGSWEVYNNCQSKDTVAQGSDRYAQMVRRTEWARDHWQSTLRIVPSQAGVVVDTSIVNQFQLSTSAYPNADLVIIMTARPSLSNIAGYASCLQHDSVSGRCTVGQFNWVPGLLDVEQGDMPNVVGDERHTALHEFGHVFGAVLPSTDFFRNTDGTTPSAADLWFEENDSAHYAKPVTKIKTPKMLAKAREQFGCETLAGVALEDQPTGKGAHWEARILGSEFMSYGAGLGEVYMSDLTLAFLEDSNNYVANYSQAGPLVEASDRGFALSRLDFLTADRSESYDPPAPKSPGYLRWGRHAGCDFLGQSARDWPDEYHCTEQQSYGCTPDYRMTAVCSLKKYQSIDQGYSCGAQDRSCINNDNCNNGVCLLPTMYQYFTADELAKAFPSGTSGLAIDKVGGHYSAADYAPVRVGYWNCKLTQAAMNSSRTEVEGGGSLGSLVDRVQADMALFGGQEQCKDCRCFTSSLLEFSKGVNPLQTRYGLCYRSNCYREDYLQIAIDNQLGGVSWYKCPTSGGKLYIAGFSGAFHCPPARTFCAMNTITGMKYPETNLIAEYIFWGIVTALTLTIICVCGMPHVRDKVVRWGKFKSGVMIFDAYASLYRATSKIPPDDLPLMIPDSKLGNPLFGLNTVVLALALSVGGLAGYAQANGVISSATVPFIGLAFCVMVTSIMGMCGARKPANGASCTLVAFLLMCWSMVSALAYTVAYVMVFKDSWGVWVDRHWDVLSDSFPQAYNSTAPRSVQVQELTASLEDNMQAIAAVGIAMLLLCSVMLLLAMKLLGKERVVGTAFVMLNYALAVSGFVLLGMGIWMVAVNNASMDIAGKVLGLGACLFCVGVMGVMAGQKKLQAVLKVHAGFLFVGLCLCLYVAITVLQDGQKLVDAVDSSSDERVAEMQQAFGTSLSREEFKQYLLDNMRSLGLFMVVLSISMIALQVASVLFILAVKRWRNEHGAAAEVPFDVAVKKLQRVRRGKESVTASTRAL